MADISVFPKKNASKPSFTKSQCKEINSLLKKNTFEIISFSDVSIKIKILNSNFVDKIKNKRTTTIFKKSRLFIQFYDKYNEEKILTQSPIIQ